MIEIRHTDELCRGDVVVEGATPFTLPQVEREHREGLGDQIRQWVPTSALLYESWRQAMEFAEEADTLVAHSAAVQRNHAAARSEIQRLRSELQQTRAAIREARREAWDEGFQRAHEQHYKEDERLSRRTPVVAIDNPYEEG